MDRALPEACAAGGKLMTATLEDDAGGAKFGSKSSGGGDRTRTDDPLLAKQVLSQLSYTPGTGALYDTSASSGGPG